MNRLPIFAALLAPILLGGCWISSGHKIVQYSKGSALKMTEAPKTGMYGLYVSGQDNPQVEYRLDEGMKLGFRETEQGVIAVAGTHETPIKFAPGMGKASYYWKLEK